MAGEYDRVLAEAQTDAMNLAHRLFSNTLPSVHWRDLKAIADAYYAPVCRQHIEAERRATDAEKELVDLTWQRRRAQEEADRWRRIAERLETEKQDEREACAAICDERAKYFDQAPAHRDWTDAARSYRATAKDIRSRSWKAAAIAAIPPQPQEADRPAQTLKSGEGRS
jgi:hypothetical protein